MAEEFDSAIKEIVEKFGSIQTTEDPRAGVERRYQQTKDFPIKDSKGNVIVDDRRIYEDRRTKNLDIDDISEYVNESD